MSELSEPESAEPLYFEPGASWWGVLFGPAFAGFGLLVELITGGPMFWALWITTAVVLGLFSAFWVYGRRRFTQVRLTREELTQGTEQLPVKRIAKVYDGDDEPFGVRVLGGGASIPRKYHAIRLGLADGSRVLAWARNGDALRTALRDLVEA